MNVIESIAVALQVVSHAVAVVVDVASTIIVIGLNWVEVAFATIAAACR